MGKSGSGKSTLLHMLGGLDTPTSGTVRYQELCLTDMPEKKLSQFRREHIGFVFQEYNLIPELSVQENILFPAMLLKKQVPKAYWEQLVEALALGDRLSIFPRSSPAASSSAQPRSCAHQSARGDPLRRAHREPGF